MTGTKLFAKGSVAAGAKAANVEFFAADLLPQDNANWASVFHVSIVMLAADSIQVTWNSGTAWEDWIETDVLTANEYFEKTLFVRSGDTVNFRSPEGTTIDRFTVDEEV